MTDRSYQVIDRSYQVIGMSYQIIVLHRMKTNKKKKQKKKQILRSGYKVVIKLFFILTHIECQNAMQKIIFFSQKMGFFNS